MPFFAWIFSFAVIKKVVGKTFTRFGASLCLISALLHIVKIVADFDVTAFPVWFHWVFAILYGKATFAYTVYIKDVHMGKKLGVYLVTLVLLMLAFGIHGANALYATISLPRSFSFVLAPILLYLAYWNWQFLVDNKNMSEWDAVE